MGNDVQGYTSVNDLWVRQLLSSPLIIRDCGDVKHRAG